MNKIMQGVIVCLLCWFTVATNAADINKINVSIGYLEVSSTGTNANKAVFNLTLQEQIAVAAGTYPYTEYSSNCPNGITLDLSDGSAATNMLFSALLTTKQGQNYVDVVYDVSSCALKAITIKYKQN